MEHYKGLESICSSAMKILCVINGLGSGGSQRQLVELAINFQKRDHQVAFLSYKYSPFFNKTLENAGIGINCIDEPNYFKRFFRMRRIIRRGKYDVVLSFLEAACFICECAGIPFRRWKLVVGERSANPDILKSPKLILFRYFHLLADYVVANSQANMKMVIKVNPFLTSSKCKVIYNMIDLDTWTPPAHYIPRQDGILRLIVVASHQYLKNLNGLIQAVSMLGEDERSQIVIHWFGDSIKAPYIDHSYPEGLRNIAELKLEGIIHFHSATDAIHKEIQVADCLGLFSFYEGFPNVICEAMACGKPVLSSAISDLPELLTSHEDLLFNPDDPKSIKRALSYLIHLDQDELLNIGKRNARIAVELFDKDLNVSSYLNLFSA